MVALRSFNVKLGFGRTTSTVYSSDPEMKRKRLVEQKDLLKQVFSFDLSQADLEKFAEREAEGAESAASGSALSSSRA